MDIRRKKSKKAKHILKFQGRPSGALPKTLRTEKGNKMERTEKITECQKHPEEYRIALDAYYKKDKTTLRQMARASSKVIDLRDASKSTLVSILLENDGWYYKVSK